MSPSIAEIDPVKYEIFMHRLWATGEEGRAALQRVSASPIVTQGGECMQSFYDVSGKMVLACSGHLRFAAVTSQAIEKIIDLFGNDPGINEGDQIFFNDPYIACAHTFDQMVIMPVFKDGHLLGWTASSSHTADTGGVLRGGATEIFHEGIRIPGLKIVEAGHFRNDVCRTIADQCRDPYYVELDLRSRIAGNNIAAARLLGMASRFGAEFVQLAFAKMIADADTLARERLASLPDGTWRSRIYGASGGIDSQIVQVVCTLRKRGDMLDLDFSGTSDQVSNASNSTLVGTLAQVNVALTSTLFWDIPWNDGKLFPVRVAVPEGTIANCKFPAACGRSPSVGEHVVLAVTECIAKMLYMSGRFEDVNAGARGFWYRGGPGWFFGGHNRNGVPVAQGLYDGHGAGFGATPHRDGVDTAGALSIPSAGISDVERIELQYPFLYLTRSHLPNGAGYGQYRGGAGSHKLFFVYGSDDLTVPMEGYVAIQTGFGLFGGFPVGTGGISALYRTDPSSILERLRCERYPTSPRDVVEGDWGEVVVPEGERGRVHVPEWWLISDFSKSGGGFGDPLRRSPEDVATDVRHGIYTDWGAKEFFGVSVAPDGSAYSNADTMRLRQAIKEARLSADDTGRGDHLGKIDGRIIASPHASLDVVKTLNGEAVWRCRLCAQSLGPASGNYKGKAIKVVLAAGQFAEYELPESTAYLGDYVLFSCPGCGELLQVDIYCSDLGGSDELWDIEPALAQGDDRAENGKVGVR